MTHVPLNGRVLVESSPLLGSQEIIERKRELSLDARAKEEVKMIEALIMIEYFSEY